MLVCNSSFCFEAWRKNEIREYSCIWSPSMKSTLPCWKSFKLNVFNSICLIKDSSTEWRSNNRQVKHISSPVISRLESMLVRRIRKAFFSKSDSLGVVLVLQYCLCAEPGWLQKLVWMKENMLRDFLPLVFQKVYKSCLLLFMDLFGLI